MEKQLDLVYGVSRHWDQYGEILQYVPSSQLYIPPHPFSQRHLGATDGALVGIEVGIEVGVEEGFVDG